MNNFGPNRSILDQIDLQKPRKPLVIRLFNDIDREPPKSRSPEGDQDVLDHQKASKIVDHGGLVVMATAAEPTMNSNIDRMNSRRWPQMSDSLPMSGMAAT